MASINSMTFDQAAYAQGATITLTVGYTPDAPGVTPTTFTATANVTDASGTVVGTSSAPFVVNIPAADGDTVSVTDTGERTWAEQSDNGSTAVFTATA